MHTYAYAIVLRNKAGDLKHYIQQCRAANKQEAKGIAHEEFEDNNKGSTISSLLIIEISEETHEETRTHSYENTRVKSEFALPDKLA